MHDIDTKLFRSFLSVATERSFSKAANRLGCSQATMSQRIRQLEDQLGLALFARGYHNVTLTPNGVELLPHAQSVVDQHDSFLNLVQHGRVTGSVRIGIAEDYVLPMLSKLLRRVRQVYPGIQLSVVTGLSRSLCSQIDARSLDLAVVTLPDIKESAQVLAQPQLHWIAAPGFQRDGDEAWPLAFFPDGCAFRAEAVFRLKECDIPFLEALVSASGQVIQAAVAAETAVTVMADGTIPSEFKKMQDTDGLPGLGTSCIQIIARQQGISQAALQVKEVITELWRG